MKNKIALFILFLLTSCSIQEKEPTHKKIYQLTDIVFPEAVIKETIATGKVCTSFYYFPNGICDSSNTVTYDKWGNVIRDIEGEYFYDKNILVAEHAGRCLSSFDSIKYYIDNEKRILQSLVFSPQPGSPHPPTIDTYKSLFNSKGQIIKEMAHGYPRAYTWVMMHDYNDAGLIIRSKRFYVINDSLSINKVVINYYYTDNKIDSVISTVRMGKRNLPPRKDFYDKTGLLYKSQMRDNHKSWERFENRRLITYNIKNVQCK